MAQQPTDAPMTTQEKIKQYEFYLTYYHNKLINAHQNLIFHEQAISALHKQLAVEQQPPEEQQLADVVKFIKNIDDHTMIVLTNALIERLQAAGSSNIAYVMHRLLPFLNPTNLKEVTEEMCHLDRKVNK